MGHLGFAKAVDPRQFDLRFRVFSQERKPEKDVAASVAIMDLRMWEMLFHKYNIDHPEMGHGLKLIDEYLCWGGVAGGEQTLGQDFEAGQVRRANTIYIYDIASFKDPIEMAREVAHEYGHAVLPAIGGFKTPEDWANGYLGERLFLRWLRDAYESGHIDSAATMDASFQSLDAWVKKNADPLVLNAAARAPNLSLLGGTGQKSMNAYIGPVLLRRFHPPKPSRRPLLQTNRLQLRPGLSRRIGEACEGASYTVAIPPLLYEKTLWLPLGKSSVKGGKVLAKSGPWAKVQPGPVR